ncbi:MAG: radical SAM protein [Candidatus Parcubacteria bacterium]|nr:radical SAM protein [Candidatus Parcubacteria bacterium]
MNLDQKHKIEYEKNKPENRRKRMQEGLPFPYPMAIAVELSAACNANCYMCPRKNLSRAVGNMDMGLYKKIIDELFENKVQLRKIFLYWMGEPLLNENFDKMIIYAKEKNVAEMVVMASNAIALNEENAKRLISSQLDELFISLDAFHQETYEKIRGKSISIEVIENNILRLMDLRKKMKSSYPYVRIKILKSDLNKDEIAEFKNKWNPIVDEVYVEEDINTWNATNENVNRNISGDSHFKERAEKGVQRWPCDRLWYQIAISQDGFVTPCIADWNGSGFIGNVKNNTIFEIWNSSEVVEMRRKHLDGECGELPMCKDCKRWIFRNMGDWLIKNRSKALAVCKKNAK